jgi:hypothetical protein
MSDTHRLPVMDTTGECLFFVDDTGARELLHAGSVRLIRRNGRNRVLLATGEIRRSELELLGRGSGLDHVRYSHQRETHDNPARVWCLTPQPSRAVFTRLIAECATAGR